MSASETPPRVGDYVKNEIGRVIYEALRAFDDGGLRVRTIGVPKKYWHNWWTRDTATVWVDGRLVGLVKVPTRVLSFDFDPST